MLASLVQAGLGASLAGVKACFARKVTTSSSLCWSQGIIAAHPGLLSGSVVDLSSGGQLPLHLAAASGEVAVLRMLLDAGADLKAINGNGETALQVLMSVSVLSAFSSESEVLIQCNNGSYTRRTEPESQAQAQRASLLLVVVPCVAVNYAGT